MVVQHNLNAMFTNTQLGINVKNDRKSIEKLASGYRINRAADDAAGLAISENMRRQIRGLNQGSFNVKDAIGFCQIADGALNEVHDMVNRLEELGVKAANGTLLDEDREMINMEVSKIYEEINKTGKTTTFNEIQVFRKGSSILNNPTADSAFFQLFGDVSKTGYMQQPLDYTFIKGLNDDGKGTGYHTQGSDPYGPYVGVHADFNAFFQNGTNTLNSLVDTNFYVNCCTKCCPYVVTFADQSGVTLTGNTITVGIKDNSGNDFTSADAFLNYMISSESVKKPNHVEFAYDSGILYIYDIDNNAWDESSMKKAYFCDDPDSTNGIVFGGLKIQMSGEPDDWEELPLFEVSTSSLKLSGENCLTESGARSLIEHTRMANAEVNRIRSTYGAWVNRFEHAYDLNNNTSENTQSAESIIRDTDMATEMVRHSCLQIIIQSGQSLLAQSGKMNEGVLQLMQ